MLQTHKVAEKEGRVLSPPACQGVAVSPAEFQTRSRPNAKFQASNTKQIPIFKSQNHLVLWILVI
jgi:hypothetical protein